MIFAIFETELGPDDRAAFDAAVRGATAAVKAAPQGTLAYEWFIDADGTRGVLIEAYADTQDFLTHLSTLRAAGAPQPPGRNPRLTLLGDLDEKTRAMVSRWPGTRFFAGRSFGMFDQRLDDVAAGAIGDKAILAIAWMTVPEAERARFAQLAGQAVDLVARNEPDTIAYEWFIDDAGTDAIVIDIYRDVDALPKHSANAGPTMAQIFAFVGLTLNTFGGVPEPVQKAMAEKRGARFGGPRLAGLA